MPSDTSSRILVNSSIESLSKKLYNCLMKYKQIISGFEHDVLHINEKTGYIRARLKKYCYLTIFYDFNEENIIVNKKKHIY